LLELHILGQLSFSGEWSILTICGLTMLFIASHNPYMVVELLM